MTEYTFSKSSLNNIKRIFEEKTGAELEPRRRPRRAHKRIAALAAAAVLVCAILSVPALAASVPGVYGVFYAIAPGAAQHFKPVRTSCEDNGIRMEVISAYIHGDTAEIYVSMRDTAGNRVDTTADLFDSYSINTPFDCSAHCELYSFDEESRTATFLISVTQWGGREITGDKITFSVGELLSGKSKFEGLVTDALYDGVSLEPDTQTPEHLRGGSGLRYEKYERGFTALVPSGTPLSAVSGVEITAMGYIGGKLHIQAHYENILETDNHGYVWLKTKSGEELRCAASVSFWDGDMSGSFEEYIFDVSPELLEECSLYGYFVTGETLTRGSWEVTFPLELAS